MEDGRRRRTEDGGKMVEEYKFQKLQVYQLALAYVDAVYELS